MSCFKKSVFALALISPVIASQPSNSLPTKAEIEALQSTHSQFEGLLLDGQSAYEVSKEYIDGISIIPTEVRHPGVVFTQEDAKSFRESSRVAAELAQQEEQQPEWMRDVSPFLAESEQIAEHSLGAIENRIKAAYPDLADKQIDVIRGNTEAKASGLLHANEDLYYFISSSMKDTEVKDMLIAAKRSGATVVIRGMIPNSKTLTETSYYLMAIMREAGLEKAPPNIIMDPRLFNVYAIRSVPAMVYVRDQTELVAHGASSPEWFLEQGRSETGFKDLGSIAATNPIVEVDILELLQRKYNEIDWNEQRKNATKKFFARQTFPPFPVPSEDKHFELDPRIVFTKDVYAGGKLLAKQGDVVNPLAGFDGHNRSLFIIDPRDPRQKSLVKERLYADSVGNPTIVVSHLDASKQFAGIAELQAEFEHQIFMLQPTYIERFQIDKLPIRVDIVGGKGIWIREYGTETLEEIHDRY